MKDDFQIIWDIINIQINSLVVIDSGTIVRCIELTWEGTSEDRNPPILIVELIVFKNS